ncbi:unnamed protein product [Durusdinium trenchii]|uniref:Uncharacterized protein n=1 Tax=Durusdinium trenchii TaxID=1381693 RepID=A0ABP0SJP5_9DINO
MGQNCCCGRVKEDWPEPDIRSPPPTFRNVAEVTQAPEGVAEVEASLAEEDLPKSPKMLTSPAATPEKPQELEQASKEAATVDGIGLGSLALLSDEGQSVVVKAVSGGKARLCKESQRQVSQSTSSSQHCVNPTDHDGHSLSDVD